MKLQAAAWLTDVGEQIRSNARLRLGLAIVLFVLWLYLILILLDSTALLRSEAMQIAGRIDDGRALTKQKAWPERAKIAQERLDSIRALMWSESEQGLAEARMQDWVSAVAAKTGLIVRDIALIRGEVGSRFDAAATPGGLASTLPPGHARVRLRLTAEFRPMAMSLMLAELAQGDRMIKVDRLHVLTATSPPLLEMELGAVVHFDNQAGRQ